MAKFGSPAKKSVKSSSLRTAKNHPEMNSDFRSLGRTLRQKSAKDKVTLVVNKNTKIKTLKIDKLNAKSTLSMSKKFDPYFRDLAPGHDEFISTSSVREMFSGSQEGTKKMSLTEERTMEQLINSLSAIRFPTKWSGFAQGDHASGKDRMQHPTSPGTGMWRSSLVKGDGNPHSELDRHRKETLLNAAEKAARGGNLETIKNEMIVSAITYTLNHFTAPATARDQRPVKTISQKERKQQMQERESLKQTAIRHGATIRPGNTAEDRNWVVPGDDKRAGTVSPLRGRPGTLKS